MSMVDETVSVDEEKHSYLKQIWYLEEQLDRCQLTLEELEEQNKELVSQYDTLKKDKVEKTKHLVDLVGEWQKKVETVLNQLKNQQLMSKQTQEALELQRRQLKEERLELIDQLHLKNRKLVADLEAKEEQLIALEQQVSKQESLKEALAGYNPAELEAALHSLKMELESDSKEFEVQEPEISETTDRKEMEILAFLLKKRSALSEDREALQDRKKDLETSKLILVKEVNSLTLQRSILQKAKQVKQMFQQLEREKYHKKQQHAQDEMEALISFRQRHIRLSEKYHQMVAQIGFMEMELKEEARRRRQLEGVTQKAAIILRHTLLGSEKPPEAQWKIQRLLEILESTVPTRTGSTSDRCTKQNRLQHKPRTSEPKSVRKLCCDEASVSVDPSDPARQPALQSQEPKRLHSTDLSPACAESQ